MFAYNMLTCSRFANDTAWLRATKHQHVLVRLIPEIMNNPARVRPESALQCHMQVYQVISNGFKTSLQKTFMHRSTRGVCKQSEVCKPLHKQLEEQ